MQTLHNELERALAEVLPQEVLRKTVASKLQSKGITLSEESMRKLIANLLEGKADMILDATQSPDGQSDVVIDFTDEDGSEIETRLNEAIPAVIQSVSASLADDILRTLKKRWPREAKSQNGEMRGFRRRVDQRWGGAIGRLRMLLTISREFGATINDETRSTPSYLGDVLLRLHARACQIVEEIVCLLGAGLADGAMARWRTLSEIAVVACFIGKHGEDAAERYSIHQYIETWKAAEKYQECYERLGYEAMEPVELQRTKADYDAALARFGENFRGDYGWAVEALKNNRPKFSDVEKAAGLDHLRAHYRMAGHNVHGNPKGAFFKLGLLPGTDLMLAGPSNAGLADPGHSAAISLTQVSCNLYRVQPTFDNVVAMLMMLQLTKEVGELFGTAHERLLKDESEMPCE